MKPSGIDERPTQQSQPIVKSDGVTPSERYLAKLAEKSFLNLWSYPNPFRDQKGSGKGDGKEICDLLVVCDKHILIFSEKTISWPDGDLNVAWCRWFKRVIRNSLKQIKGAERWVSEHPNRIFLDRECTVPLPIGIPSPDERVIHRVIVARGAAEACRRHFPGHSGSLIIKPYITADEHWIGNHDEIEPFAIGDVDPTNTFVHIMDEVTLDVIMQELDTIRDLTDYLEKKARFVRSGRLLAAIGEENLLAHYAIHINEKNEHDFEFENEIESVIFDDSYYSSLTSDPRYIRKRQADKISYLWDRLIEIFTKPMLAGELLTSEVYNFNLRDQELGVRYMALQRRFERRSLGEAFFEALEIGKTKSRFFQRVMKPANKNENDTAFFFHTLKYLTSMGRYEEYRKIRIASSLIYARGILERYSYLKRIVGIACEPSGQNHGGSEDLIYLEQADWSDEQRLEIRQDCKKAGVLQNKARVTPLDEQEFPDVKTNNKKPEDLSDLNHGMNRKQRRAMKAKARRRK